MAQTQPHNLKSETIKDEIEEQTVILQEEPKRINTEVLEVADPRPVLPLRTKRTKSKVIKNANYNQFFL